MKRRERESERLRERDITFVRQSEIDRSLYLLEPDVDILSQDVRAQARKSKGFLCEKYFKSKEGCRRK